MASLFDVFRSAQSNAQRVSVENRDSINRTNQSIITTGRGATPANIFTITGAGEGEISGQEDLKQIEPNTLNRLPRVVGRCVTGGVVIDKTRVGTAPNGNAIHSYIIALSHTHIDEVWSTVNTNSASVLNSLKDTRFFEDQFGVIVGTVEPGFCITATELTPTADNDCWYGSYDPAIYYNGQLCLFGSNGVVTGLADPEIYRSNTSAYEPINNNFRVAVYVGHTDGSNQVFPGNSQNADQFATIPANTSLQGMVFACVEVTSDPDLDITGLGEWRFGLDNFSNYLPPENLYTRERKNNPALVLEEYLTDTRYGLGIANTFIDTNSFSEWRSNCDLDVFNGTAYGGNPGDWKYQDPDNSSGTLTTARWMAINNAINSSLPVGDNIKRITQAGLAQLHWDHEEQLFRIIKQRGQRFSDIENLFKFTSDNIMGRINITSGDFFSLPTYAQVNYPDRRLLSETNSVRMEVSAGDRQANEPENGVTYNFPMINGRARAQVMANISLYENREDTVIEFDADYSTRDTKVGDYVTITDEAQGLDTQVARIIKITEQIGSDGALFYSYQCKKYSDKPFQPQSYSDDPYEGTDTNIFVTPPIYIRVVQAIVFDNAAAGTIDIYDYNYATNANTDVTPSSITASLNQPKLNMPINYGYPSFAAGEEFIAFAVEGTGEAMDFMKVVARVGNDYWSPSYGGHVYTFTSPLDGDPDYTGNTRYFVLKTSKLGQSGTTSQPSNYSFDINYFYSQSYPNNETNVFTISHPMDTWDITGNAMVTVSGTGDTYIEQSVANTTVTSTAGATTQYLYDVAQLASDNYYLGVLGTANVASPGGDYTLSSDSYVEVRCECEIEYDTNRVSFPTGSTESYPDRFVKQTRLFNVMKRWQGIDIPTDTDQNFAEHVALDIWDDLGLFPGKCNMRLRYRANLTWDHPTLPSQSGTCELTNLKYQIRNNSRMRVE